MYAGEFKFDSNGMLIEGEVEARPYVPPALPEKVWETRSGQSIYAAGSVELYVAETERLQR